MSSTDGSAAPVLFSASAAYFGAAAAELRAAFPGARTERLGPDAGLLHLDEADALERVHRSCASASSHFSRHLADATHRLEDLPREPGAARDVLVPLVEGLLDREQVGHQAVAVQVWESEPAGYRAESLRHALAEELQQRGVTVRRSGARWTLSLCLGPVSVLGLNESALSLSDWPGGRIRLAKSKKQLSRAEFKLEELFSLRPDLARRGTGLDLGAAPGGWTRILLERGLDHVVAVDPGDLAPSLVRDRRVEHVRTTSHEFLRGSDRRFDVVVNDMKMEPRRSVETMLLAADAMPAGGTAIVTFKITPEGARSVVAKALELFSQRFEVDFARQLQHNRNEITVVGTRR